MSEKIVTKEVLSAADSVTMWIFLSLCKIIITFLKYNEDVRNSGYTIIHYSTTYSI